MANESSPKRATAVASETGKASGRRDSAASASGSPSAAPSPSLTSSSILTEEHGEPASKPVKEKRKRSRVTPEQLTALESIFAVDRSPTAARRKDISVQLGMDERQTQVWFQNRGKPVPLPLVGRVQYASPSWDAGLTQYIHEDQVVEFIRCTELHIGSWTRRPSATSPSDLLVYTNLMQSRLSVFVRSEHSTCDVKLDVDLRNVANIHLTKSLPNAPNICRIVLVLHQPPAFFMAMPVPGRAEQFEWVTCHDWTENCAASQTLQHIILGQEEPLTEMYRSITSQLLLLRSHTPPESLSLESPGLSAPLDFVSVSQPQSRSPYPPSGYMQPGGYYNNQVQATGLPSPPFSASYTGSPPIQPSPVFDTFATGTSSPPYAPPFPPSNVSTTPLEPVLLTRRLSMAEHAQAGPLVYEPMWYHEQ